MPDIIGIYSPDASSKVDPDIPGSTIADIASAPLTQWITPSTAKARNDSRTANFAALPG